jgi:adenylate cyclase
MTEIPRPTDLGRPPASRILIDNLATWLMQQALADHSLEEIVTGCCERLQAAGVPLARAYFAFAILHPLHSATGITWTRGKKVIVADYPHVPGGVSERFLQSPHHYMLERRLDLLRCRLADGPEQYSFPILDDLRADGITDYVAFTIDFMLVRGYGMVGSWATDARGGFSDSDMEDLLRIQRRLAVACKVAIQSRLMNNLATTYLGPITAANVLEGQIKRGDGQSIEAAIWLSDLRGSTRLAATLPRQDYIDTLNSFFDLTGGAVQKAGGEILDFIGDSVLAIFPNTATHESAAAACQRALSATCDALRRQKAENDRRTRAGKAPLEFGLGLHLGEVMYGNVGVPERLTFSAFGVAVHEVERIQSLTRDLHEPVLASAAFVNAAREVRWRDLGEYQLRGVDQPTHVHALQIPSSRKTQARD